MLPLHRSGRVPRTKLLSEKLPCQTSPPRLREGNPWERGRAARMLCLWPPQSFRAMLPPATLPVGTASARRKESHGAVPGGSKWGRGPRLRPAWCGRDARAPRRLSSDDAATPRALKCRSLLALLVDEGGPSVFRSVRVPSWLMSSSFDSFVDSRSVRPPKRILRTDRQRSPSNQWRQLKLLSCAGGLL